MGNTIKAQRTRKGNRHFRPTLPLLEPVVSQVDYLYFGSEFVNCFTTAVRLTCNLSSPQFLSCGTQSFIMFVRG